MNGSIIERLEAIERELHNVSERLAALERRMDAAAPAPAAPGAAPIVVRMTGRDAAADEAALSDAMTRRDALEVLTGQRVHLIVLDE